jgi:ATP-dependent protease ClpP protease subunit
MSEIKLFGVIGQDVLASDVKDQLAEADRNEELIVRIDSPGGSVFVGNAIHSAILSYDGPKRAIVESFAGSIASYILTAFDRVDITANGYVMIHNPSMKSDGDDEDHERDAKLLREIKSQMIEAYVKKLNDTPDNVAAMMKSETFFSAGEAVEAGLVTSIVGERKASSIPINFLQSMPFSAVACLRDGGGEPSTPKDNPVAEKNEPVAASVTEIRTAFPKMSSDFVLKCVEKEMPMASVAAAASEELIAENETLSAKNQELQEQVAAFEAKEAEAVAQAEAEKSSDEEAKAKAKANGPVAVGNQSGTPTASARWSQAVSGYIEAGMSRAKAVATANRSNPGLRDEYLSEVNAR